jgi:hypothetical protein
MAQAMRIKYPEIGICGLSCRLCPSYHRQTKSRCPGCKTEFRMGAPCPFMTCALKKKEKEFCWECDEAKSCARWKKHREFSMRRDSAKCYQTLEKDIAFIRKNGAKEFEKTQKARQKLLEQMLEGFNEGRSKTFYSIAATVMDMAELKGALAKAKKAPSKQDIKGRSEVLHGVLDEIAARRSYLLKLRK